MQHGYTRTHTSTCTMASTSTPNQSDPKNGNDPKSNQPSMQKKRPILSKSLGTAAGLSKLLPTGTTLAFQTMAPSFTRGGECDDHDVNFAFTWGLIIFLTLLSAALNFTDSVDGKDGKTHYGVTTGKRLRLFNDDRELIRGSKPVVDKKELRRRKLRLQDVLHAFVSAAVFLALAFCDAGVQRCLGKKESQPWKDFFNHLPLAVGFLATFLFIIYPTTRKGIGEDGAWGGSGSTTADGVNKTRQETDGDAGASRDDDDDTKKKELEKQRKPKTTTSLLAAAATLSKLLPTGTTLAFQTMAPSFTNGGDCKGHRVNFAFTWGLIGVLTLTCAVLSFTDSVTDPDGHTHYGLATPRGFCFFNHIPEHLRGSRADWKELRIRQRDFVHAIVSAAVFVTVALCDAGVQGCLVPEESTQWRQFLALLPLAVTSVASFLFVVFPSDRKGIGEEGAADRHQDTATTESTAVSVARVAPSDVVQLDSADAV